MRTQTKQNVLKEVLGLGQSIWYDGFVSPQEFRRMIEADGLRGATTNPTIFEKAISEGKLDHELKGFPASTGEEEIFKTIAVKAVQEIADVFKPVFDQTRGRDGFVSMEVSPLLAYDTARTIEEARELRRRVARPNLMVKIPATRAGIPAIEAAIAEGIHVNVTLIFSVQRYREVMNAYLTGLERRTAAGLSVKEAASVASFFVSRVDTSVDKLLESKGASRELFGKSAIANSKDAYAAFEEVFSSERFRRLEAKGARRQRPLWASTGTKNPAYGDVFYVEALIGPDTVDTIPPGTLEAFRDHGRAASTLTQGLAEAAKTLKAIEAAGVSLADVTAGLEKAGVELFSDSYRKLLEAIREKRKKLR